MNSKTFRCSPFRCLYNICLVAALTVLAGFGVYYSSDLIVIVLFTLFALMLLLVILTSFIYSITIDETAITQVSLFKTTTISKDKISYTSYSKGGRYRADTFYICTGYNQKEAISISLQLFSNKNRSEMANLLGIVDYFNPIHEDKGYGYLIAAVFFIFIGVMFLLTSTKPTFNDFQKVTGIFDSVAYTNYGSRNECFYICLKDGEKYMCTVIDSDKTLKESFEKNVVPGENIELEICDVSSPTSTQIVSVTIGNKTYLSYDHSVQYFTGVHSQYRQYKIAGICLILVSGIFVLLFIVSYNRHRKAIKDIYETDYSTYIKKY